MAVNPTTGQTVLNLILFDAYSIAIALLATLTAALDAAYQASSGLGRIALVEAMLMKTAS
jgi:hypothetical protein